MKRFARLAVLGAMILSSTAWVSAAQADIQKKLVELKKNVASSHQPVAEQPWLQSTLSSW